MCAKLKIEVDVMDNLVNFLTSKEVIIVYIVAAVACMLCFIIYLVEKNNEKLKQRHNTKELNKLVEQLKEEEVATESEEIFEQPIIQYVEDVVEESVVNEMINETSVEVLEETPVVNVTPAVVQTSVIPEEVKDSLVVIEDDSRVVSEEIQKIDDTIEELQYTTIEPDQQTAKLELKKLTDDLRKQEELAKTEEIEKIALTNYEEQQEATAIISLEELVRKGKEMYESNEVTQYEDEGNEPISLEELEKRNVLLNDESYTQPFIIENVVDTDTDTVMEEQTTPQIISTEEISLEKTNVSVDSNIRLDSINPVEENTKVTKKFRSSPIISPIYGIEKSENNNDLALENTANYEKFDQEIKKSNEFLMSLKELQKNLD